MITDTATQRNVRTFAPAPSRESGSDLIRKLNALAKEIDPSAVEFPTSSETALKLFSAGLSTTDSRIKAQRLKEAIASDPSFGLAYVVLLQLLSSEYQDAKTTLKGAEEHRSSFVPLDKAHFDIIRAQLLRSPAEEKIRDAENLLKLAPNEPEVLASLALAFFEKGE